jgi:alkylated DNA repair protein (DNA oxidative demethylase)
MTLDLFPHQTFIAPEAIGPNAFVLRNFATPYVEELLSAINTLEKQAAFRNMATPGGFIMSVAITNCGRLGWTTDQHGYRYSPTDPDTGQPWPPMPATFRKLAKEAAAESGFADFEPDACLVNRYLAGSRLSLHQDKDEHDFNAPIVSVSLGMPAVFLFGGRKRTDKAARIPLMHGDVVVWGGVDRLRYHGVLPLKENPHPLLGTQRVNLTFRKAG